MIACMGGWCAKREQCPHHNTSDRRDPAERLCLTGRDGDRLIESSAGATVIWRVLGGDWCVTDDRSLAA